MTRKESRNHLPKRTHAAIQPEARGIQFRAKRLSRRGGRTNQRGHRRLCPPPTTPLSLSPLNGTARHARESLPKTSLSLSRQKRGTGRRGRREGERAAKSSTAGRPRAHVKTILACDETSRRRGTGRREREREAPVRISRSPIRRPPIRRSGADRGARIPAAIDSRRGGDTFPSSAAGAERGGGGGGFLGRARRVGLDAVREEAAGGCARLRPASGHGRRR
jgi:hypothetical protein